MNRFVLSFLYKIDRSIRREPVSQGNRVSRVIHLSAAGRRSFPPESIALRNFQKEATRIMRKQYTDCKSEDFRTLSYYAYFKSKDAFKMG